MDLRDQYKNSTLRILGKFQLLEFALKHYIGFAYDLIRKNVNGAIHFGYSIDDVDNYPLERLLNIFSKLNNNSDLLAQLNGLRTGRNHVAHKSLLVSSGENYDTDALKKADEEFFYLEDEIDVCLAALLSELQSLKSTLFGSVA
ncbi:hypothetical protein [Oleiagrimonas sp. C23AA]|uniref:hypothetical protein n=1 Tax=Oleiagrimonas sp. C23AA TaxID=2719047 RepID=UPI0014210E11|nr:hypothetical protein [Oleiagrimonas sp. C23AA]NII10147.1 hypothetical protein [Oleiagrimonas sp. C23AA]